MNHYFKQMVIGYPTVSGIYGIAVFMYLIIIIIYLYFFNVFCLGTIEWYCSTECRDIDDNQYDDHYHQNNQHISEVKIRGSLLRILYQSELNVESLCL